MTWRVASPKVFHEKKGPGNKRAMKRIVSAGPPPGLLAYVGSERLGLNGTPAFLIGVSTPDGKVKTVRFVSGARPYADFKAALDAALAAQ